MAAETLHDLHASLQTLDTVTSSDYWRRLCPQLHVEDSDFQQRAKAVVEARSVASPGACAAVRGRILQEGFASLPSSEVTWSVEVEKLAQGILNLQKWGWAPTFIVLYDEAWVMGLDAAQIMELATGNSLCMDIVGFLVDPSLTKGFSPHRDRQPEDWVPKGVASAVSATFKEDGMAKYVTLWAALTDATPDNSCLHFVPADCDPGYYAGDPDEGDPLQRCFAEREAYQNIRAVPLLAGGCSFHTHRSIHWGNRGRRSYEGRPRVALSFGFSTGDFEPAYFSQKHLPFPSLALRAALAAAQVLNYATLAAGDAQGWRALAGSMEGSTASTLALMHKVFQRQAKAFHASYRKEVSQKFVKVSLSLQKGAALGCGSAAPAKAGAAATETAEDNSDEDDEALEAMLSSEAATGEVLFHDDFDMMNDDDGLDACLARGKRRKGQKGAAAKRPKAKRKAGR